MSTSTPAPDPTPTPTPHDQVPASRPAVPAEPRTSPGPRSADLHEEPPGTPPRSEDLVAPDADPGPDPEDINHGRHPRHDGDAPAH